jgi:hypothetical protein
MRLAEREEVRLEFREKVRLDEKFRLAVQGKGQIE